jgi:hypothetical protein
MCHEGRVLEPVPRDVFRPALSGFSQSDCFAIEFQSCSLGWFKGGRGDPIRLEGAAEKPGRRTMTDTKREGEAQQHCN